MNSDQKQQYECKDCHWKGAEEELDYDEVESCFGNDKLEICPVCGSMNVVQQKNM